MLKYALINHNSVWGVTEIRNCVQCTITCGTVKNLKDAFETLNAVEAEVVAELAELKRVEKLARSSAGYYVKQVLDSRMWNEDENE